jgi:drug/metabolite transporter (DMT)-like permease
MTHNTWIGLLAALAAAAIGSSWQLLTRYGVTTSLGPLELATLRYALPALLLLPVLVKTGLLPKGVPRRVLLGLVVGGGLPFGLLVLAGAQWAPAAHIGIFMAGSVPLFTALGSLLRGGEPVGYWQILGYVLVALGLLAFGLGRVDTLALTWRGDLLLVLAGLLWSVHTLSFRRSGLSPWQGAALTNAWSALLLVPALGLVGVPRLLTAARVDVAVQAVGQGVLAGLLGLVVYLIAVTRLGAAKASLSAALVPTLTACGAAWWLREALTLQMLLALALTAAGLVLASGVVRYGVRDGVRDGVRCAATGEKA